MEDLTNIWNTDDELNEGELLKYIKGNATQEEQHAVETKMANSGFVNDAMEGLQQIAASGKLNEYVQQLNKHLHQQLLLPKQRKEKRKIKELTWITIAVAVVLLLCILGYWVIRMRNGR